MSGLGLGDEQETRSVFVEAVNDAESGRVTDVRKRWKIIEKSVGESTCLVARGGVGGQASGFIDGEQVVVFVDDAEGEGLGRGGGGRLGGKVELKPVCLFQPVTRFGCLTVDPDPALVNQLLDGRAGEVGAEGGEVFVQAFVGRYWGGYRVRGESHRRLCPWSRG